MKYLVLICLLLLLCLYVPGLAQFSGRGLWWCLPWSRSPVMPIGELKKLADASLPLDAPKRWQRMGLLHLPDGKIEVFDPSFYPSAEDVYFLTLQAPSEQAEVFLELIEVGEGDWRAGRAEVRFVHDRVSRREEIGEVSVDSGYLAIAPTSRLEREWRVGGPKSESHFAEKCGWRAKRHDAEATRVRLRLEDAGFGLQQMEDGAYDFIPPLSDQEIDRAERIVEDTSSNSCMWVYPNHTWALLMEQLFPTHLAILDDENPWIFAFVSGWGDGTYEWFALKNEHGEIIGFTSQMISNDEG